MIFTFAQFIYLNLTHNGNITLLFPIEIFLPTPDSLLVNLNECKEVRNIFDMWTVKNSPSPPVLLLRVDVLAATLASTSIRKPFLLIETHPMDHTTTPLCSQLVQDLLKSLPHIFEKTMETQSALGPALQAAFKLLSPTGGRVSVFQTQLPSMGVGALKSREDPNQRASAKVREWGRGKCQMHNKHGVAFTEIQVLQALLDSGATK